METLRTSSYMIPVKLEKEESKYMLIHGYTGAMDIVTETLLDKIKNISTVNVLPDNMITTLLKRGYITIKTQEEEYAYVARMARALHEKYNILYTTFTWVVTYNCNFRCPYCYEEKSFKNGSRNLTFTKAQVDIAYKAQELIQPNENLRKKTITLYGGEPFLEENKEIVEYIVEEGHKKGYVFSAITNGYELNHFLDLLGPEKIYKLQITIDGAKNIHNERRPHYKDRNTFDVIIDNIEEALKKNVKVVVRMNADSKNISSYPELEMYLRQKGFLDYPNFTFYFGFIKDNKYITDEARETIDFISVDDFIDKQQKLGVLPFKTDSGLYRKMCNSIKNRRPYVFNPIVCVAQSSGYVLDPFGNIYPCWEVINDKQNIEGFYSKEGVRWNNEVVGQWRGTNIAQTTPCNHCKYALICGGGCPYHRRLLKKDDCLMFRKLFNVVVNKAYADSKINV